MFLEIVILHNHVCYMIMLHNKNLYFYIYRKLSYNIIFNISKWSNNISLHMSYKDNIKDII